MDDLPVDGAARVSRELARSVPKVSLHCHLLGSVPADTAVELARANGVELPGNPTADDVYDPVTYRER